MSYPRNQSPPRIFDHLQNQYNNEAYQRWSGQKRKKNLYFQLANMDMAAKQSIKNMEKQLQSKQNQRVRQHLKAENDRYAEAQRKKKAQIDQARQVNKSMSIEIMNASKQKQEFQPFNDYPDYCYYQHQKQKKQKAQFLKNAQQYQQIRKQIQNNQKVIDMSVSHQKRQEQIEQYMKRQAQLKMRREKHQPVSKLQRQFEQISREKQMKQKALQDYIVNQGKNDQQARLLELRGQFQVKQRDKLINYVRQLKNQVDNDTYRHIYDKKKQTQDERRQIDQRNRYYSELDQINRLKKRQEDKQMLDVLKSQVKPRKLIQEPDHIENVGLGSPVNIGKVMGDDRKRQLDWIQRSLLKQMYY